MSEKILSSNNKKRLEEVAEREIVDEYLRNLGAEPMSRKPEDVVAELQELDDAIESAAGIERLELLQRREDLTTELYELRELPNPVELEAAFIEVAQAYAKQAGVSYSTFREFGVAKSVLEKAGIRRTRRKRAS